MHISDIIQTKGQNVVTISPSDTIADAVDLLKEHGFGAVVVSNDGRTIAGIISERDIVRHLAWGQEHTLRLAVEELMTAKVITCRAEDTVDSVMATMTDRRIRHVPVVDDSDQMVGLVSIGDVVKWRLDQLEQETKQLQDYIASGR